MPSRRRYRGSPKKKKKSSRRSSHGGPRTFRGTNEREYRAGFLPRDWSIKDAIDKFVPECEKKIQTFLIVPHTNVFPYTNVVHFKGLIEHYLYAFFQRFLFDSFMVADDVRNHETYNNFTDNGITNAISKLVLTRDEAELNKKIHEAVMAEYDRNLQNVRSSGKILFVNLLYEMFPVKGFKSHNADIITQKLNYDKLRLEEQMKRNLRSARTSGRIEREEENRMIDEIFSER